MDPEDFLFEQHDYGYDVGYGPPPRWWDLRARWATMSGGGRTNLVLYALSAVSLALLLLEVTSGENSPDLQVAGQVVPVASSTTSTTRPVRASTTTSRPASTTSSTVAGTSRTTVAAATGTTRRATAPAAPAGPAPAAETEDPAPPADETPTPTPTPTNPPQQTTTPTPTSPATTAPPTPQPTATSPPVTLSDRACELLADHGRTFPGCP